MWSHAETVAKHACIVSGPLARGWLNGVPIVRRGLTDGRIGSGIAAAFIKVRSWVLVCRVVVTAVRCVFVIRAREKQLCLGKRSRHSEFFA